MDPVHKISIVQRGFGALGYTLQLPLEERYLMTRSELMNQLAVLLAGRSAEEVALGEISTGAQNDLVRATDLARSMVAQLGMGETLGVMSSADPTCGTFSPGTARFRCATGVSTHRRVRRSRYFVIDRHHLAYLNGIEKLNCVYCGVRKQCARLLS